VLGATAELVMTTIALRDLARRPANQVRGWKPFWMVAFVVQPIGPVVYFLVGRRRPVRGCAQTGVRSRLDRHAVGDWGHVDTRDRRLSRSTAIRLGCG
jgi:Phospholipase_D-nuclease N-terminal